MGGVGIALGDGGNKRKMVPGGCCRRSGWICWVLASEIASPLSHSYPFGSVPSAEG